MLSNKRVANYLSDVKFDIEQDNDVTSQGDWDEKDIEAYKALDVVIRYLLGE